MPTYGAKAKEWDVKVPTRPHRMTLSFDCVCVSVFGVCVCVRACERDLRACVQCVVVSLSVRLFISVAFAAAGGGQIHRVVHKMRAVPRDIRR